MLKKITVSKIVIYLFVAMFSVVCLLPFWLVAAASITPENMIGSDGFRLIPRAVSFAAYDLLFRTPERIINGYKVTAITTVVGTLASLFLSAMLGYGISRPSVRYRRFIEIYTLITMLFSGGMVPWYIICVNYLKLTNNYAALIMPMLLNAWNVFLIRNYFRSIPNEMHESAKIDGAGEFYTFLRIILPLSLPVLATLALFIALGYWNGWWLGLMLIDKDELQPLQLMLRSILSNVEFLRFSPDAKKIVGNSANMMPSESAKMATCIITIGPIIFLYPFIQRYFVKGIMIGAIKG